ncbi:MAG: GGDEF domain-containing protein [Gemmataceae bacterium]|nr:GGDEF domain-containing protein [Gemmataceae bacterium]
MSPKQATPCAQAATAEAERETEVARNPNCTIRSTANQTACLVQIYPANAGLGRRHRLDQPAALGRDVDCEIPVDDASVSRYHARVVPRDGDYYVTDLRSTNGTFVNDGRALLRRLADGDYVRVGNHIFRFLAGGNIEADYHEEIFRLTITDALTAIHNKRHLLDFLERELTRTARHHRPLALLLFDIDHFKAINDTHGHLAGDAVLRALATRLRGETRRDELFARYGGEEFAVVLPETDLEGAVRLAERLRKLVAVHPFEHNGKSLPITISLGATATGAGETFSVEQFLAQADEKLYQAKQQGRNRVVASDGEPAEAGNQTSAKAKGNWV